MLREAANIAAHVSIRIAGIFSREDTDECDSHPLRSGAGRIAHHKCPLEHIPGCLIQYMDAYLEAVGDDPNTPPPAPAPAAGLAAGELVPPGPPGAAVCTPFPCAPLF